MPGATLDPTRGGVVGCAWGAEVAEFCRFVPGCAGWKPFKVNEINAWLKTGSQEVASSILASSTNKTKDLRSPTKTQNPSGVPLGFQTAVFRLVQCRKFFEDFGSTFCFSPWQNWIRKSAAENTQSSIHIAHLTSESVLTKKHLKVRCWAHPFGVCDHCARVFRVLQAISLATIYFHSSLKTPSSSFWQRARMAARPVPGKRAQRFGPPSPLWQTFSPAAVLRTWSR